MRQSEVRVRAGVEAWHLVRVHWLEYRFRVLWADFTFFLDTGSAQRKPELVPSSCRHSGLGSWHLPERAAGAREEAEAATEAPLGKLSELPFLATQLSVEEESGSVGHWAAS